jgi:hypothetical protein
MKYQLFDRAADNFAMLFMKVPDRRKDAFFENYHGALAQAVYAGFWTAFPKSQKMPGDVGVAFDDPSFKQELCTLVSLWTTGRQNTAATNLGDESWDQNRLLKPESLGKETAEDKRKREVHQRYVERFGTAPGGGGPAKPAAPEPLLDDELDPEGGSPQPAPRDAGIDIYSNSPFIQHFLLTHNWRAPPRHCHPSRHRRRADTLTCRGVRQLPAVLDAVLAHQLRGVLRGHAELRAAGAFLSSPSRPATAAQFS